MAGGSAPWPTLCYTSCISLFDKGPKFDNFSAKKFTFGSSPLPLSKILVALLVAFIAATDFSSDYMQYFNCKILHARTLSQPCPNVFVRRLQFSENFASISESLFCSRNFAARFSQILLKTYRKSSHRNLKGFCLRTCMETKKRSLPQFGTVFGRKLVLTATFLSNRPDAYS